MIRVAVCSGGTKVQASPSTIVTLLQPFCRTFCCACGQAWGGGAGSGHWPKARGIIETQVLPGSPVGGRQRPCAPPPVSPHLLAQRGAQVDDVDLLESREVHVVGHHRHILLRMKVGAAGKSADRAREQDGVGRGIAGNPPTCARGIPARAAGNQARRAGAMHSIFVRMAVKAVCIQVLLLGPPHAQSHARQGGLSPAAARARTAVPPPRSTQTKSFSCFSRAAQAASRGSRPHRNRDRKASSAIQATSRVDAGRRARRSPCPHACRPNRASQITQAAVDPPSPPPRPNGTHRHAPEARKTAPGAGHGCHPPSAS